MRTLALTVLALAAPAAAETPFRNESDAGFAIDPRFQDKGGVQLFYALLPDSPSPETAPVFAAFRPFDARNVWDTLEAPPNVVISRLAYTVEKDVSFFSEARVRDVGYINAIAKDMEVTKRDDGTFRVGATPANTFSLDYYDAARVEKAAAEAGPVKHAIAFAGIEGVPASIVAQENRDFARVMGWRTGEGSFTWTLHFSAGPGRTRIVVFTMSYLRSMPPFFLGGAKRVYRESTDGARVLIDRLRAYRP